MIKIILAEDHLIVRKGICALLAADRAMEVVAEAGDGLQAAELTEKFQPDVLLLDLALPRLHGIAVVRRVVETTQTRILILSMHSDGINVRDALAMGAMGYVLKDCSPEELLTAIRSVKAGEPYVSSTLRKTVMDAVLKPSQMKMKPWGSLTQRERHVFENAAAGFTNGQIAEKLFISCRTVESHRASIMKKLRLGNQTDLVRFAIRQGIVVP